MDSYFTIWLARRLRYLVDQSWQDISAQAFLMSSRHRQHWAVELTDDGGGSERVVHDLSASIAGGSPPFIDMFTARSGAGKLDDLASSIKLLISRVDELESRLKDLEDRQAPFSVQLSKPSEVSCNKSTETEDRLFSLETNIRLLSPPYFVLGARPIRSRQDVEAQLAQDGDVIVDAGLLPDWKRLFEECHAALGMRDRQESQFAGLKMKVLARKMGISPNTGSVLHSNKLRYPRILCAKSTKPGTNGGFGNFKHTEWRHNSVASDGIAETLENRLPGVTQMFENAINDHYYSSSPASQMWRLLSLEFLTVSSNFISSLIKYIDEQMNLLVTGGSHEESDAMAMVMNAVRKIFDVHFAPVHDMHLSIMPTFTSEDEPAQQRRLQAVLIWNAIQTLTLTKELLKQGIRNHSLVSSAYNEWALCHSGRLEAKKAMELALKAAKERKELAYTMVDLQKTVKAVQRTIAKQDENTAQDAVPCQASQSEN